MSLGTFVPNGMNVNGYETNWHPLTNPLIAQKWEEFGLRIPGVSTITFYAAEEYDEYDFGGNTWSTSREFRDETVVEVMNLLAESNGCFEEATVVKIRECTVSTDLRSVQRCVASVKVSLSFEQECAALQIEREKQREEKQKAAQAYFAELDAKAEKLCRERLQSNPSPEDLVATIRSGQNAAIWVKDGVGLLKKVDGVNIPYHRMENGLNVYYVWPLT